MDYLNKMTVKELKSIADRMDIAYNTRTRKSDLVASIEAQIEYDWELAKEVQEGFFQTVEDSFTIPGSNITVTGVVATISREHFKRVKRYNPTLKRDKMGKIILTPKQRRRIAKKNRRDLAMIESN